MKHVALAGLVALATVAVATPGWAFCRATTCDPNKKDCTRDIQSCLTEGQPLFWASSCMQVYVQKSGSLAQGIGFATVKDSVSRAFGAWLSADCDGAPPLLDVQVLGPITCDTAEYNPTKKNANIVLFRDDEWPYPGSEDTLAFTHLLFNADTGELWDSDMEINSFEYQFSTGNPVTSNDLDSMLTHEIGHMLGLAHTLVKDATMYAQYQEGTDTLRTLSSDDLTGICAAYPPDRVPSRTSCSPRHGFSDVCGAAQPENSGTNEGTDQEAAPGGGSDGLPTSKGCAVAGSASSSGAAGSVFAALALLGLCALRRRSLRHQFVSCWHPAGRR